MKKVFILAASAIMMASAANLKAEENNNSNLMTENVEGVAPINYTVHMNMRSLSRCLNLTDDQVEVMSYASDNFKADIAKVATEEDMARPEAVRKAINRNLKLVRNVLEDKQYRDYLALLNRTLNNKGLSTLLYADAIAMND